MTILRLRDKHGREMLFEAAWLSDMPAFDTSPRPHALSFYDIMLVTRGGGAFSLDEAVHPVAEIRLIRLQSKQLVPQIGRAHV